MTYGTFQGKTVIVLSWISRTFLKFQSSTFPHQLSFEDVGWNIHRTLHFDLRGGILGDAPGLGKTVTMLALTKTAGSGA